MTEFHRYVAIGDSTTEGLEDPYPDGGYRGWADRLAEHVANAQDQPLDYANLAVRGLRLREIRDTQLGPALALEPDLMTIFGGVNDALGLHCDFPSLRADYEVLFGQARLHAITVLTLTMPDPTAINPLGRRLRDRMFTLNDIICSAADRHGVLVMDFQRYPVTEDRRLWFEDRLHGNPMGHERVAAALAWRLGVDGTDDSWSQPLEADPVVRRSRQALFSDLDWAVHYLAPWLGRGLAGIPHSRGVTAKRPVPTLVPKTASEPTRTEEGAELSAGAGGGGVVEG